MLMLKPNFATRKVPDLEFIKTATWTRTSAYPYRGVGDSYRYFPEGMFPISDTDMIVLSRVYRRVNSRHDEYYVERWRYNEDRSMTMLQSVRVPETGIEHNEGGPSNSPIRAYGYMHNGKLIIGMHVPVNWRYGTFGEIDTQYWDSTNYRWVNVTADVRLNRVIYSFDVNGDDVTLESDVEHSPSDSEFFWFSGESFVSADTVLDIGEGRYLSLGGIGSIRNSKSASIECKIWALASDGSLASPATSVTLTFSTPTDYSFGNFYYDACKVGSKKGMILLSPSVSKDGGATYESGTLCEAHLVDFSGASPSLTVLESFFAEQYNTTPPEYDPYSYQRSMPAESILSGQKNIFNDVEFSDGNDVAVLYLHNGVRPFFLYDDITDTACVAAGKTFVFFREQGGQIVSVKHKVVSDYYARIARDVQTNFVSKDGDKKYLAGSFNVVNDADNSDVFGYRTVGLAGFARVDFNLLDIFGPDMTDDPEVTATYAYIRTFGNKNSDTYWLDRPHSVRLRDSIITFAGESAYGDSYINDPFTAYFLVLDCKPS